MEDHANLERERRMLKTGIYEKPDMTGADALIARLENSAAGSRSEDFERDEELASVEELAASS